MVPVAWYEATYRKLQPAVPLEATFAIQTNGVAISPAWIDFLRRSRTEVGISIDGPQRFHDARRKTRAGTPTWSLVMGNLRSLQSAGLCPNVFSVLHPECLSAADDFYRFYRNNDISHVSFSIDEADGANAASSFDGIDHKPAMIAFLRRLLNLAFSEGYPLHVKDIERIARILAEGAPAYNEQVRPWDILAVAANGDVTSFSPEFMELKSADHDNFCFGNILRDSFDDLLDNAACTKTANEIRAGVELCRSSCQYFGVCEGGSPSNKMFENKSLASGETLFCRLSIQAAADALTEFLRERSVTQVPLSNRYIEVLK